ncbi:hypothetical protein MCAMS1_02697 [biofilm metagenome]
MKKLLVVMGLVMAAFSFQVSAASLSWNSTPAGSSTAGSVPQALFGSVGGLDKGIVVNDVWSFNLDSSSLIQIGITSLPSWLTSVTFSGGALTQISGNPFGDIWTFSGVLAAGNYDLQLIGKTLTDASGYQLRVETPIPAAIWLFGSALMGLTGLSRRKQA